MCRREIPCCEIMVRPPVLSLSSPTAQSRTLRAFASRADRPARAHDITPLCLSLP
jgi:hypothetical protein